MGKGATGRSAPQASQRAGHFQQQQYNRDKEHKEARFVEEKGIRLQQWSAGSVPRLDLVRVGKIEGDLRVVLITLRWLERAGPEDNGVQPVGEVSIDRRGRLWRRKVRRLKPLDFAERQSSRQRLVERHTDREDFRALTDRRADESLGREVTGGAGPADRGKHRHGAAEIDELEAQPVVIAVGENVVRLEVAVNEVMAEQILTAGGKEFPQFHGFIHGEPAGTQQRLEARRIDEFHEVIAGGGVIRHGGAHEPVGIDARGIPCFADEGVEQRIVLRGIRGREFQHGALRVILRQPAAVGLSEGPLQHPAVDGHAFAKFVQHRQRALLAGAQTADLPDIHDDGAHVVESFGSGCGPGGPYDAAGGRVALQRGKKFGFRLVLPYAVRTKQQHVTVRESAAEGVEHWSVGDAKTGNEAVGVVRIDMVFAELFQLTAAKQPNARVAGIQTVKRIPLDDGDCQSADHFTAVEARLGFAAKRAVQQQHDFVERAVRSPCRGTAGVMSADHLHGPLRSLAGGGAGAGAVGQHGDYMVRVHRDAAGIGGWLRRMARQSERGVMNHHAARSIAGRGPDVIPGVHVQMRASATAPHVVRQRVFTSVRPIKATRQRIPNAANPGLHEPVACFENPSELAR